MLFKKAIFGKVTIGADWDFAQLEIPEQLEVFSPDIMRSRFGAYSYRAAGEELLAAIHAPFEAIGSAVEALNRKSGKNRYLPAWWMRIFSVRPRITGSQMHQTGHTYSMIPEACDEARPALPK